jgi:predicted HTH transcriptional regulator
MSDQFALTNRSNVATQLRTLADLVESGHIRNYQISQDAQSISFIADAADGRRRVIKHQHTLNGLRRESTEHIEKAASAEERREVVAALYAEKRPQVEIAKRTMVSQKTISNDLKWLRQQGKIK